jgi:hypothetical protein
MTHPVDAMLAEADAAIDRMKAAALEARHLHARAELARHMRATAAKMAALPVNDAAAAIAREWMAAWALNEAAYGALAAQVAAFTLAFCLDARGTTPQTRAEIVRATAALEAAFIGAGASLSDEMAYRSECAHGWWAAVRPIPEPLRDPARASRIPTAAEGQPFWTAGPQAHCR